MYQISREKMPELLAAVAKEMDLFLPVQNNGITNFGFWTEDADVDLDTLKTVKSPKDAFFPQSEILYSCYQKANKTSIEPAALKDAPFAIFGIRQSVRCSGPRFLKRACRRLLCSKKRARHRCFPGLS